MRHRKNRRLALAYALIVAVELLVTVLAGWAVARWAIPYAYAERGYWAVGGEWILTAGAALFALWATNHMFFGGVRNAGKVQKMPQDTYVCFSDIGCIAYVDMPMNVYLSNDKTLGTVTIANGVPTFKADAAAE